MVTALRVDLADISHWQSGPLDFAKARRSGLKGVWHKATEGLTWTDDFHHQRRIEVGAVDRLLWGSYHFATVASSAKDQAKKFLDFSQPASGDLFPFLDLEDSKNNYPSKMSVVDRTRWVSDWVEIVRGALGIDPIIYTKLMLADNFDCALMIPRYNNDNREPIIPDPWTTWTIWQFSDGVLGVPHSIAGLGNVDLNTLNTSQPNVLLRKFTIPIQEEDMPTAEEIAKAVWAMKFPVMSSGDEIAANQMLRQTHNRSGQARDLLKLLGDIDTFAQAIADKINIGGVDGNIVKEAVKAALREGTDE